jgi:hypothetical protein
MNHRRQIYNLGARQLRFTDANIFNVNLNEPKPRQADPSDASFMFVALYQPKYIWQLLTEVEPVNSSPYSYNRICVLLSSLL